MYEKRFRPGQNAHTDGRLPHQPQERRFGWYRTYNDFPFHPKWRVVAKMAGVKTGKVVAIVDTLFAKANVNKPRGSLVGWSVFECAAALDFEFDEVARVYAALEETGWIDQEFLVTWDERQPDKEDPTNSVRQQRFRDRKRAERIVRGDRNAVTSVTVTPRQDKDIDSVITTTSRAAARADIEPGESAQSGENESAEIEARSWLFGKVDEIGTGERIVCERLGVRRHTATVYVDRWLKDAGQDAVALKKILQGADREAINDRALENVIGQAIRDLIHERLAGPKLQFGPAVVKGGKR